MRSARAEERLWFLMTTTRAHACCDARVRVCVFESESERTRTRAAFDDFGMIAVPRWTAHRRTICAGVRACLIAR